MASGAVALVFSFFHFYSFPVTGGVSVWGKGLLPVATFIPIFCVVMGVQVALEKFAGTTLPQVPGFSWGQVHLAAGFFAALLAVGYLVQSRAGLSLGIGYFGELIGGIGALVGAILLSKDRAGAGGPTV